MSRTIPVPREPIILAGGQVNPIWWRYLQGLSSEQDSSELSRRLSDIARKVADLESRGGSNTNTVVGDLSIESVGVLSSGDVRVRLRGDVPAPPENNYYGTDAAGSRGFHPLPRSGVLPVVTGEVSGGQPVFVHADDGSLIYSEVA